MHGRGGRRQHNKDYGHNHMPQLGQDGAMSFSPNSPVLMMFKTASVKLQDRQDRHERLVKLSRDVTIESKRIIFQLHSIVAKADQTKIVGEALERLNVLVKGPIKAIGLELENIPAYLHSRAISPGLQEFIEAKTLCHFIEQRDLIPWQNVQKELTYDIEKKNEKTEDRSVTTLLPKMDYMLGLADLTGELMRRTINSISSGDSDESVLVCQFMRSLYSGFLGIHNPGRELSRKWHTTHTNTLKAEGAIYAVSVRGGEAPPLLLATDRNWDPPAIAHSNDEGYYYT